MAAAQNEVSRNTIRPNKKIPVFRVTQSYLNLLVKPKFLGVLEKNIILCILKGKMPFKMHIFFYLFQKKKIKKSMCLPYLKYSDPLPETQLFFYLA